MVEAEKSSGTGQPATQAGRLLKPVEHLNISVAIDAYGEIFSDFDPRPYNERALSEDFLSEVRRRHIPKRGKGVELRFIVPDSVRNQKTEAMIKRRLKGYFNEEAKELGGKVSAKKRRGYTYIMAGAFLLVCVTFLSVSYQDSIVVQLVELLLTPAGWFGMWEGIGKVVERDDRLASRYEVNRMLSESSFVFIPESVAFAQAGGQENIQKPASTTEEA
jgi:hypothetical protein